MKIGIIGAGNVGSALAKKWIGLGYFVQVGVRDFADSKKVESLKKELVSSVQIKSISQMINESDVVVLATPWGAVESLVQNHQKDLVGKILIDCTNPLNADLSGLILSADQSGGELLQKMLLQTRVVKAFNTVGFNIMEDPIIEDRRAMMYFCGNDLEAKKMVKVLIESIGFEPFDAGNITSCRMLEPLALLWINSAYKFGLGRDFAFSVIRKK